MKKYKGYTLIEILVVLTLLSILLSMAVPNLSLYRDIRENMELERLKKDLLFARNSAILESVDYYITFDHLKNSYYIQSNKDNKIIKRVYLKSGIKLNDRSRKVVFHFKRNGKTGNSDILNFKNRKGEFLELVLTPVTGNISIRKKQ